ncbi:MAG: DUF47 family protein [Thermoproteota archaeon]|nr:DUF47 family protein [Thermoproteota archaeon]
MEKWFIGRRRSKVLDIAYRQMTLAIDTVTDLEKSIVAASGGNVKEARRCIERLFVTEREIDCLRRTVFEESTKGSLPSRDREDLMHLVKRLDTMADDVKDAGRSVLVLLEAEVPEKIWSLCVEVAKDLVECATTLRRAIELLGSDVSRAVKLAKRVDEVESMVDDRYLDGKRLLLSFEGLDCGVVVVLKELFDFMEDVADSCTDTADYVRVLAVS